MLVPLLALFNLALCLSAVKAQLVVTQPTADHWWVGGSLNTLAWTGTSPAEFQVFLVNADKNVLTDRLAIESIVPTYIKSKSINPGGATAAKGYTLELTNPLNSTEIYATSEVFEIKPSNSAYPPQDSASSSGSSANASASASASGAASPSASSSPNSAGSLGVSVAVGLSASVAISGLVIAEI